jgi:uncharacterized protein (DUF1800 family)
MMQAEIAVMRFGLGAKPGDLTVVGAEPRAWLMSQIRGPAALAVDTPWRLPIRSSRASWRRAMNAGK